MSENQQLEIEGVIEDRKSNMSKDTEHKEQTAPQIWKT